MAYSREHLGSVKPISGRLVIIDPSFLKPERCSDIEKQANRVMTEDGPGQICDDKGVALPTPFLDSECQIFGHYNEKGDLVSVEIMMNEEE